MKAEDLTRLVVCNDIQAAIDVLRAVVKIDENVDTDKI